MPRQYYSNHLPTHDLEEITALENLTLPHSDEEDRDLSIPIMQRSGRKDPDTFFPPTSTPIVLFPW